MGFRDRKRYIEIFASGVGYSGQLLGERGVDIKTACAVINTKDLNSITRLTLNKSAFRTR